MKVLCLKSQYKIDDILPMIEEKQVEVRDQCVGLTILGITQVSEKLNYYIQSPTVLSWIGSVEERIHKVTSCLLKDEDKSTRLIKKLNVDFPNRDLSLILHLYQNPSYFIPAQVQQKFYHLALMLGNETVIPLVDAMLLEPGNYNMVYNMVKEFLQEKGKYDE